MDSPILTKRDFLKTLGLSAAAVGLHSLHPGVALANAIRKTAQPGIRGWDDVRDAFPLTHDRVYFNNGTLGPSPKPVIDAIAAGIQEVETTGETYEAEGTKFRGKLADFVGAKAEEISLTHNTTEGTNIVAQGLRLRAGDEVILTTQEHVGGALPWLNRARLDGIVLKSFVPPRTAAEVLHQIEAMITDRTRVIAVPHLSCTTGQVFPLREIAELAESRDLYVFVDGAHGTGMLPLRLNELGVHFYSSSTHKWLCGPKGVGYLYVRKDMLDELEPRFVGAYSDSGWSLTPPKIMGFNPTAHRFDFGTQNSSLYVGASAAIDFFKSVGTEQITDHGCGLALQLQDALDYRAKDIESLTPAEESSRAMITSFRFRGSAKDSSVKFAAFAAANGFRVRQVSETDLNAIRISTHLYNSQEEVRRFVAVIDSFLKT